MRFDSLSFLAFAVVSAALIRCCNPGMLRHWVIAAVNLAFIGSFAAGPLELIPLGGFVLFGYWAMLWGTRSLGIAVGLVVALFVWLKKYNAFGSVPSLSFPYVSVGLSYVLFRVLHLTIDVAQGASRRPGPLEFWNYVLFFPSFVSGPIQRFQEFSSQAESARKLEVAELDEAINRLLVGYLFIVIVAPLLLHLTEYRQLQLYDQLSVSARSWAVTTDFAAAATLYLFYLYFNFAGYMHIVIAIGTLAGFRLPENFNAPFRSANFLDFWSRWHITLADWFRYYLFNPLAKALIGRWGTPGQLPYLGAIAFFCTFLVMGIWHGTSRLFVVYGVMLAAGVTVNKVWQIEMAKRLGRDGYKRLTSNVLYRSVCRAAALSYFAVSLTCMWIDGPHRGFFLSRDGLVASVAAVVLLTVIGGALVLATDFGGAGAAVVRERLNHGGARTAAVDRDEPTGAAWVAAKIAIVAAALVLFGDAAPEFVYKAF